MEIRRKLEKMSETAYGDFIAKLTPGLPREKILGVRLPALRSLARELDREHAVEAALFIMQLPHETLEENHLHALLVSGLKSYHLALRETERFLPYIDNWGVCDSFRPKALQKEAARSYPHYLEWLKSEHFYTRRFGIGCLMRDFLGERFRPEINDIVLAADRPELFPEKGFCCPTDGPAYYLRIMLAWYLSEALIRQWEATLPLLESGRLDSWLQRKSIQKAVESRRLSAERKTYLKSLRP